jgi:hypothetical protein
MIYFQVIVGRQKLADSRSPASSSERQLLRKLPFRIEISVAIADPKPTLGNEVSRAASCPERTQHHSI